MAQYINKVGYGLSEALPNLAPFPIQAQRAPTTADKGYAVGTIWIDMPNNDVYVLTSVVNNLATWVGAGGGAGLFTTLTTTGQINLDTTDAATNVIGNLVGATSLTLLVGTGGFGVDGVGASNYAIGDSTTTGIINIGGTSQTGTIQLGLSTVNGQTVAIAAGIGNSTVEIANDQTGGAVVVGDAMTTGTITLGGTAQTGTLTLGSSSGAQTVVIAGGAGASVVQIANAQVAGSVSVGAGMTTGTISIGGTGAQTGNFILAPSTGAQTITLGNNNGAKTINIGNGVSGNTIDIGTGINTSAQVIRIGTGASAANSTVAILTGDGTAGQQTFSCMTGTRAGVVDIGTGAADHVVTIGSTSAHASTVIHGGGTTNGIIIDADGLTRITPLTDTQASPTAATTLNVYVGSCRFTGFTTASAATQVFTFNNALVTATSQILCSVANTGANDAQMTVTRITPGVGAFTVTCTNNGAAALNGDVIISFMILA